MIRPCEDPASRAQKRPDGWPRQTGDYRSRIAENPDVLISSSVVLQLEIVELRQRQLDEVRLDVIAQVALEAIFCDA